MSTGSQFDPAILESLRPIPFPWWLVDVSGAWVGQADSQHWRQAGLEVLLGKGEMDGFTALSASPQWKKILQRVLSFGKATHLDWEFRSARTRFFRSEIHRWTEDLLLVRVCETSDLHQNIRDFEKRDQGRQILMQIESLLLKSSNLKDGVEMAIEWLGKGFALDFTALYQTVPKVGRIRSLRKFCGWRRLGGSVLEEWPVNGARTYLPRDLGGQLPEEELWLSASDNEPEFVDLFEASGSATLILRSIRATGDARYALLLGAKQPLEDRQAELAEPLQGLCDSLRSFIESKLVEEELERARSAAVAADQAKSEFLAMMSHEIRTPMNAIIGFSDLLKKSQLDSQTKEYLDIITRSGHNLLDLINSILDFSKLESQAMDLEMKSFRLETVLMEVLELGRVKSAKKGIQLKYTIPAGAGQFFRGDPLRLKQILINLVTNAIKFTEKGWVNLRCRLEKLEGAEGAKAVLEVEDTGIGMDPEFLPEIFKAFRQADSSTTRKYGGTGLGMTIVRRLVDLMNGQIRVESRLEKGTLFTVEIPMVYADPPLKGASAEIVAGVSDGGDASSFAERIPMQVLVVEDDPINGQLIQALLRKLGYPCVIKNSGWDGIDQLRRRQYDCLLVDIHMAGMDGVQTVQRIRKGEAGKWSMGIVAVALTAVVSGTEKERILANGLDLFLAKPVHLESLEQSLVEAWNLLKNRQSRK